MNHGYRTFDPALGQVPVPVIHRGLLNVHGFRGREYNSVAIGKTMKRLGFEKKTLHGVSKYLVTKVDYDQHSRENKEETREFVPEIF